MFAKIFSQIFESSIADNPDVRFTFMDMLVLADVNGVVDMTHEAIARKTNRPLQIIRETLDALEGPDKRSRTPDCEGARIKRLDDHRDWGWMIVNYQYYRECASEEQRRQKTRARVSRHREKIKEEAQANGEGETFQCVTGALHSKKAQHQLLPSFVSESLPPPINTQVCQDAWDNWQEHCRQRGKKITEIAARAQIKKLQAMGSERAIKAIEHSIEHNYQGIWEPNDRNASGKRPARSAADYKVMTPETAT